jgi:hypothetical protein
MMQTSRPVVIHTYDGPWQRWYRSIGKRLGRKVTGSRYALAALAARSRLESTARAQVSYSKARRS